MHLHHTQPAFVLLLLDKLLFKQVLYIAIMPQPHDFKSQLHIAACQQSPGSLSTGA